VTVCMTNSQCTWRDNNPNNKQWDLPNLKQSQPDTVRTVLQLLDRDLQTVLAETTLLLKRDAPWGRQHQSADHEWHMPALDDARLFLHHDQIFVSYREGPGFGYETQVLNPIHFVFLDKKGGDDKDDVKSRSRKLSATLLASETTSFCCGRNMALMGHHVDNNNQDLYALTWVDPVTVIRVDTTPLVEKNKSPKQKPKRRLLTDINNNNGEGNDVETMIHQRPRRQLKEEATTKKQHKSHIHGTNAFMVPLPNGNDYLGVAHFHRPNDRKPNQYARFGHHYTHAFYTVSRDDNGNWKLSGLSPEFVLPSAVEHQKDDAEIIQFVSGLEVWGGDQVLLAYGINDCEAALTTINLTTVTGLLRAVDGGKQVVDFMQPLRSSSKK